MEKGVTIIPCELINHNSDTLKRIIFQYIDLWNLDENFKNWILGACTFHNTLVDRMVPGYPRDQIDAYNVQLDYENKLIVSAETFFLWVIEGDEQLKAKLPFHNINLDVKTVNDMQPYRTRKVRILNGAHTAMVPFSILYGNRTVKESLDDDFTGPFIKSLVFDEIIPTLSMDKGELNDFAEAVLDRFRNPFIEHQLSNIALNSISKFKVWVLPNLLEYTNIENKLPVGLVFSFACLIRFYKGRWQGKDLPVNDNDRIMAEMTKIWESDNADNVSNQVLGKVEFWDEDLNKIKGLKDAIALALEQIEKKGIQNGFNEYKKNLKSTSHAR